MAGATMGEESFQPHGRRPKVCAARPVYKSSVIKGSTWGRPHGLRFEGSVLVATEGPWGTVYSRNYLGDS